MNSLGYKRLFAYCDKYRRRRNEDPSFRRIAKRFGVTLDEVENAANDAQGNGLPVSITIGMRIQGVGDGEFGSRGEWQVETWEEDMPR